MKIEFKFNVKWDEADKSIPRKFSSVVEIDDDIDINDESELSDFLSDWLSDNFGYCHNGFTFKIVKKIS